MRMGGRRTGFNKGQWRTARERCRLADDRPPAAQTDSKPIEQVISGVMKKLGLEGKQWLQVLGEEWPVLVGADVARHTRPGSFQAAKLTVYVDSSVWLNELARYGQGQLLSNLQRRFGAGRIKSISLRMDPDT